MSEVSGYGCLTLMLEVEAETVVLRDTVRSSDWAVTCSAEGQGISSSSLHSSSEQSSQGCSSRWTGSFDLGPEAATIHLNEPIAPLNDQLLSVSGRLKVILVSSSSRRWSPYCSRIGGISRVFVLSKNKNMGYN